CRPVGSVGLVDIHRHKPWVELPLAAHKFNGHIGTPGGLRVFGVERHSPCGSLAPGRFGNLDTLLAQPCAPHIMSWLHLKTLYPSSMRSSRRPPKVGERWSLPESPQA